MTASPIMARLTNLRHQASKTTVENWLGPIVSCQESVVLRRGEIELAQWVALHSNSWRIGTRATACSSRKLLLLLQGCNLLSIKYLSSLVHNYHVRPRYTSIGQSWGYIRRILGLGFVRSCPSIFSNIVESNAVVDSRKRSQLHCRCIRDHVALTSSLLRIEVGNHRSI